MNRRRRIFFAGVCMLLFAFAASLTEAQEVPPTAPSSPAQDSSSKDKPSKKKYSHANDFLIRGTVFNEKALSFPDVELRLRKEGEKKYKWETYTNSRGEFAVRVPHGSNYEILVHVKGFADQSRTIEAKGGGSGETVLFRMQQVTGDAK